MKTFQSNLTRIASTTRTPIGCRIVATVRERKIDAQFGSAPDNFCFRQQDQRSMDSESLAFHAGFRCELGKIFKRRDELRPAIRIAAVIERVDADEDIGRVKHFRARERVREKNGVSRRHISDRNAGRDFFASSLSHHKRHGH